MVFEYTVLNKQPCIHLKLQYRKHHLLHIRFEKDAYSYYVPNTYIFPLSYCKPETVFIVSSEYFNTSTKPSIRLMVAIAIAKRGSN
jgi:hypothetical protein